MTVMQYRKKPVVISAMRLTFPGAAAVAAWCGGRVINESNPSNPSDFYTGLDIPTLEGVMRASVGDYVIRGVQGEFYPCKPDIFEATYERLGVR